MTDSVNSRELVLAILLTVTKEEEYSHIAITNVLEKYQYLDKQERAFITRVSEGTMEHMLELDYMINQFSKVKVNKMKPVIRCILRSAVYEIKYMDSIPLHASCNEAVKLAKRKGFGSLSGFVNGVLRNIGRSLDKIIYPKKEENTMEYLSVTYSMPEWLIELWSKTYSMEEMEHMCEAFFREEPLSIRVNLNKITPEELTARLKAQGITVRQDDTLSYALHISGIDYLRGIPEFEEGLFYVQDINSMKVAEAAGVKKGSYVIDVCGAPGGKSIHIAQMMQDTGMVVTRDVSEYKVGLIEENIARHQVHNMRAELHDARILDKDSVGRADVVIADLPCSGLGVLRKKSDIKYRMNMEKIESLAGLQQEILNVAEKYVKDGGIMVYSTCTIDRMENEDNVEQFLKTHTNYILEGMEQILPDETGNDGFFIARLRKSKYE